VPIASNAPSAPAGPSGFPEESGNAKAPTSSARLNIHGGTSVAWGETQVDPAPPVAPRAKWPLVAGALGLLCFIASGTGAVVYARRVSASHTPPAGSMTLPTGRKDLPPVVTATPPSSAEAPPAVPATVTELPSALPSSRVPTRPHVGEPKPLAAAPVKPVAGPTAGTTTGAPGTPRPPPADDLSNIGRR
jgi:hypothetical protein